MKQNYKKILDKVTPYQPGKPIEEVKREYNLENVIKLASNENPLPVSPKVLEAIAKSSKCVARYPDGACFRLKSCLSKKLKLSENNIVFGNGSDEIIILALRAFINPGDEVIVSKPTFSVYKIAAMIEGAEIKEIPAKKYKYDLNAMYKAVTKATKIIFIANPDNPTGTYVSNDDLRAFIDKLPKDILIFIDEAYYEFARGEDYPETFDIIKRQDRNVVIARTFSKAYGLAGLRVGYGVAREDIALLLNKVREPFNVNSIAQAAAIAALEDNEHLQASVSLVLSEKEKFYQKFESLGLEYIPSRANFIAVNTKRDSKQVFEYLLRKGIIVREMSAWGLDGFIRVNIGLPEENEAFFKAFMEAIEL
ncbi:MAG: histidinol-phosphate transaminase [Candidatus Omnitrophota bacterium]